jgi:DNA-binding transcriptional MerR regulator
MKIGDIAAQAGVPAKTIRFWEDQHLIPDPPRTATGYRDYSPNVLARLSFIQNAQAAGFTLAQIRQILDVGEGGERPCAHVAHLIDQRIAEVEARIAELTRTHEHLKTLAQRAEAQDPADCRGYCSIISG